MTSKKQVNSKRGDAPERDLFDMSESDEEYIPEVPEPEVLLQKRERREKLNLSSSEILSQMMEDYETQQRKRISQYNASIATSASDKLREGVEVINSIIKEKKSENNGIFHFAGKLYSVNSEGELEEVRDKSAKNSFQDLQKLAIKYTTQADCPEKNANRIKNLEENQYRELLLEKKANLKCLVGLLNNRHRNVSAIFKSRIDWKKYTVSNQLDKQLEQNRKDGFIEKQKFLVDSNLREKKSGKAV